MSVTGRDVRIVDGAYTDDPAAPVGPPVLDAWVRFREVPDDPYLHAGLLAQFTGHVSIAAALRPHEGIGQHQAHRTLSTAINAIALSLHGEVRADRWMLYHHLSTFAGDGMTHSECRVHDEAGGLLASFTVDAMVRAIPGRDDDRRRAQGVVSLTTGRGPLSRNPAGRFSAPVPEGVVYVESFRRRVRGIRDGRTVVDSERVVLVHRPGEPPGYAFPATDVDGAAAEPEPDAPGYVRVPWEAVEEWYEEDERVFGHPRNPYHRVDCVRTSRHLRVEVAGVVLVDTTDTVGVYETALEPRLYVPRSRSAWICSSPGRRGRTAPTRARRGTGARSSTTSSWRTSPGRTTTHCPSPFRFAACSASTSRGPGSSTTCRRPADVASSAQDLVGPLLELRCQARPTHEDAAGLFSLCLTLVPFAVTPRRLDEPRVGQ